MAEYRQEVKESIDRLKLNHFGNKRSFYVGGFDWAGKKMLNTFIKRSIWQNGWANKFQNVIDSAKIDDIIFLKSTARKKDGGFLRLYAIGIIFKNQIGNGTIDVNWFPFESVIELKSGAHLRNAIQKIGENYINDILVATLANYPLLPDIIDDLSLSVNVHKNAIHKDIEAQIESNKNQGHNFWWINDAHHDRWKHKIVQNKKYIFPNENFDYLKPKAGELLIVSTDPILDNKLIGVFEVIDILGSETIAKLVFRFNKKISVTEFQHNKLISDWLTIEVFNNDVNPLPAQIFQEIFKVATKNTTKDNPEITPSNPSKIAQQIADLDKGEDYLGIDKDVTAFAKVIASNSFSPPLAIALFGQWGTGKSFFMNKLKDRIQELSQTGKAEYRSGIAQIHFNAWSYLDANLWASIVTKIFQGLNEYIGNDSVASENKKQIEKELKEQLNVLKEERKFIEHQKETNEEKIRTLQTRKKTAKKDLNDKIQSIKSASLYNILEKVNSTFKVEEEIQEALDSNPNIQQTKDEIKKLVTEKYWNNPELALKEAKSIRTFIYEFFNKKNIGWNIFGLVCILALIVVLPQVLNNYVAWLKEEFVLLPQMALTAITFITPILTRYKAVYDKIQPIIGVFWTIKQQHEKAIESAMFVHNQFMESVKIEIKQKKSELEILNNQIEELQTEIAELDYKLENTLSTQALYSFIEQRAKGDVYKKHLGIISTIRNDFEVLSELFDSSNKETKNEEFKKLFSKPLERIVLYIDDLDRCPEDQVVEVLEAVNLLMAFPLFVVVVGVDPRWIKNALIKKYELQFGDRDKTNGYERIDASNYLEKIFQVPFHLEQASDDSVKLMLKELSLQSMTKTVEISGVESEPDEDELVYSNLVSSDGITLNDNQGIPLKTTLEIRDPKTKDKNEREFDEHLSLSESEIKLFQEMSGIIGVNPRAVKRFVNIYRIVRAHEGLTIRSNKDSEYLALMFLLALPMGPFSSIHKEIIQTINTLGSKNPDAILGDLLSLEKTSEPILEAELRKILSESEINELINNLNLLNLSQYNKFIQRFTFSELV
ncbi:P-loop NTPase fold protein [Roseivirga pacifica]|uniref:P-loop NTPase fold protein n=1 Tax=Roseivirga pacifica TaxID=1267423 RepID=UPI003BAE1FBC